MNPWLGICRAGQAAAVTVAALTPVVDGSGWAVVLALAGLVIFTVQARRLTATRP